MPQHTIDTQFANEMIGLADSAAKVADEALLRAEQAEKSAARVSADVTLVKVAKAKCDDIANKLSNTGVFGEYSTKDLSAALSNCGAEGYLSFLEKLASRAIFAVDDSEDDSAGDLVEKSATRRGESSGDPWRQAVNEAKAEFGNN